MNDAVKIHGSDLLKSMKLARSKPAVLKHELATIRSNMPSALIASQDAIALQQIKEQGALADIDAGRFDIAVGKVRKIWASLPGAGYGQRENKLEILRAQFAAAGGMLA